MLSLITSLYRAQNYLPQYLRHVQALAHPCEMVVVANDATEAERNLLASAGERVRVLHVGRESLYASWNRGVEAAQGDILGFWNVDDVRYAAALADGERRVRDGATLVDFPFEVVQNGRVRLRSANYAPGAIHRKAWAGTFFLFHRRLYEQVGGFDPYFKIAGDLEWSIRAAPHVQYAASDVVAGRFVIHGDNLSNSGSQREAIEQNLIMMRYGAWDEVRPTPTPEAMRAAWDAWGVEQAIPDAIADKLWGADARRHHAQWYHERQRRLRGQRWRALPKWLIDRLGLRKPLAKLGIVSRRSDP